MKTTIREVPFVIEPAAELLANKVTFPNSSFSAVCRPLATALLAAAKCDSNNSTSGLHAPDVQQQLLALENSEAYLQFELDHNHGTQPPQNTRSYLFLLTDDQIAHFPNTKLQAWANELRNAVLTAAQLDSAKLTASIKPADITALQAIQARLRASAKLLLGDGTAADFGLAHPDHPGLGDLEPVDIDADDADVEEASLLATADAIPDSTDTKWPYSDDGADSQGQG